MKIKHMINQKGFTLIEILIAIALFAALTAMLYPAYIGTFKNMDITESYSSIYRMARIAADRISDDLESACMPSAGSNSGSEIEEYQIFSGEQLSIGGRHMDTIQFISEKHLSLNGDKIPGRGVIKYYSKQFEDEDGFTLYRSDDPELGNKSQEGTGGLAVCEGLNAIYFFYQDENGETYDRWDSTTAPFTGKLPALVSIQLEFLNKSDPEKPIKFITSVALPPEKKRNGSNS
jgi:prepilin-type N-terminal cleavage/methylation domain-containing protein